MTTKEMFSEGLRCRGKGCHCSGCKDRFECVEIARTDIKTNPPIEGITTEMKFKELSDWIVVDGHCATRILKGGDASNVKDRVAFIEKTPRVRVSENRYSVECEDGIGGEMQKRDAWIYGYKDSDYGESVESREWCDKMLTLLGYE